MTIELVKILEQALEYAELSSYWFEVWQNSGLESDRMEWHAYDAKAQALCEAYEIFTGSRIRPCEMFINRELAKA